MRIDILSLIYLLHRNNNVSATYSSPLKLAKLQNDQNGFVMNGINADDESGYSVSHIGDFNGDGYDDVIIGAYRASPYGNSSAGQTYIVYGAPLWTSDQFELSSLDGSNGFVINGANTNDYSGYSVSGAGDFNGDGYDDVIIGAYGGGNDFSASGTCYVLYGGSEVGINGIINLKHFNENDGIIISGSNPLLDTGYSVSGNFDFNNDGYSDVIIGAPNIHQPYTGYTYIIFGGINVMSSYLINDINQNNGLIIQGRSNDYSGSFVSSGGDFNGDGYDDLLIGSFCSSNQIYLIYGGINVGNDESGKLLADELNGQNGFMFNGIEDGDCTGWSVSSAGDFNGDGYDDLIIGAPKANSNIGESYIIFGGIAQEENSQFNLSSLDGSNGFALQGVEVDSQSGYSVSMVGDINGDNFTDVMIGSLFSRTTTDGGGGDYEVCFIVFGSSHLAINHEGKFDLTDINGNNGIAIQATQNNVGDFIGSSVSSAGDFNGDGYDDLLIGAYGGSPNYDNDKKDENAGQTYLLFPKKTKNNHSSDFLKTNTLILVVIILGSILICTCVSICLARQYCGCCKKDKKYKSHFNSGGDVGGNNPLMNQNAGGNAFISYKEALLDPENYDYDIDKANIDE